MTTLAVGLLTAGPIHPAFDGSVTDVVRLRAKEQVRRAIARRRVAPMADIHAIRDGTDCGFVGATMGVDLAIVLAKTSVALGGLLTWPQPAVAEFDCID
jgi:hypothetical protein